MKVRDVVLGCILYLMFFILFIILRFYIDIPLKFWGVFQPVLYIIFSCICAKVILSFASSKKAHNKILFISIAMWFIIFFVLSINMTKYVCMNVDNIAQIRIIRYLSGHTGTDWVDYCETIPGEHFDDTYWVGYFNGTYNLNFYKILGWISKTFNILPEILIPIVSIIFVSISVVLSYLIYAKLFNYPSLLPLAIMIWNYENPAFFVLNGWFMQNVLNTIILAFVLMVVVAISREQSLRLIGFIMLGVFALVLVSKNIYNISAILNSPQRFLNNTIDIYRMIYSANYFIFPALTIGLIKFLRIGVVSKRKVS